MRVLRWTSLMVALALMAAPGGAASGAERAPSPPAAAKDAQAAAGEEALKKSIQAKLMEVFLQGIREGLKGGPGLKAREDGDGGPQRPKRDPFFSLMTDKGERRSPYPPPRVVSAAKGDADAGDADADEGSAAARAARIKKAAKELEDSPPIPLEVYRKIKEDKPGLHKALEENARFFRDKKTLEKLSDRAYREKVDAYKALIGEAHDFGKKMLRTPLQGDLRTMRLAGVVRSGGEAVALVETREQKGYSVRKGALLGARFGVAESVSEEKIEVIERYQDYLGNVTSQSTSLELGKTPVTDKVAAADTPAADKPPGKEDKS